MPSVNICELKAAVTGVFAV